MNESAAQSLAVSPLVSILGILGGILGLLSLLCWILEIVAAFKKEEKPLMGILSIVLCGLGGFIIGWINAKKWGIQKLMLIWTAVFLGAIVIQVISMVMVGAAVSAAGATGAGM